MSQDPEVTSLEQLIQQMADASQKTKVMFIHDFPDQFLQQGPMRSTAKQRQSNGTILWYVNREMSAEPMPLRSYS